MIWEGENVNTENLSTKNAVCTFKGQMSGDAEIKQAHPNIIQAIWTLCNPTQYEPSHQFQRKTLSLTMYTPTQHERVESPNSSVTNNDH